MYISLTLFLLDFLLLLFFNNLLNRSYYKKRIVHQNLKKAFQAQKKNLWKFDELTLSNMPKGLTRINVLYFIFVLLLIFDELISMNAVFFSLLLFSFDENDFRNVFP